MVRPSSMLLPSVVFFYSVCVVGASVGRSEMAEDVKKSNSRANAAQDPFMSVTLAAQAGDAQSSLFSKCLATSRSVVATFESIEVVPGKEYIRYVPDSFQMKFPIPWNSLAGSYTSIFDCSKAANDGGWPMFKYDGVKCHVVNTSFSLDDVGDCKAADSDAVFILSTANIECPLPRFRLGQDGNDGRLMCGLVNEDLMTYDEAAVFCKKLYNEFDFDLFYNIYYTLTVEDVIAKVIEHGYTKTNLWTLAFRRSSADTFGFTGYFDALYWFGGTIPPTTSDPGPASAAYMDPTSNFKLREGSLSFKAGALCTTYVQD